MFAVMNEDVDVLSQKRWQSGWVNVYHRKCDSDNHRKTKNREISKWSSYGCSPMHGCSSFFNKILMVHRHVALANETTLKPTMVDITVAITDCDVCYLPLRRAVRVCDPPGEVRSDYNNRLKEKLLKWKIQQKSSGKRKIIWSLIVS